VALLVGITGAWAFLQLKVPSYEVPRDLVGMQYAEVTEQVGDFGWKITKKEVYRDGTTNGEVLDSSPKPGSSLREGGRLTVTVSLGPTLVERPPDEQLAGLSQAEADSLLREPGLELVPEFVRTSSEDVDEGKVIGLDPATPDMIQKGATVKVLISSGPPGTQIPDMKGWDQDDAEDRLEDLEIDYEVKREPSREFDEGKVVRTDPGSGTEVDEDETVTLVVSSGDALEVPDLADMTVDEARDELESMGLKVGRVNGPQDGIVWSTSPWPGSEVEEGDSVDLWTSDW
jgi:beta-lactam-binding protein with PASTA domain